MKKYVLFFMVLSFVVTLCTAPVTGFAVNIISKTDIWTTETFEEYTKDVDWLQNLDSNKVVTATGVGTGKWRALNTAANNLNKGTVMVVDGTKVDANYTGGNVLEINALTTSGIGIRRNANPNATTGVPFNGTNPGKKVIYEVDVFMPSTTRSYNNAAFAQYSTGNGIDVMIDANKNGPYITTQSGAFYARQSAGSSSDAYYSSSRVDSSHFRGKWQHIKYVVDVSAAANATAGKERFDTSRMYLNGHLKTGVYANDVAATYAAYPKAKGDKVIDYLGRMGKPTAANTFYGVSFCMNKLADTSTNTYTGNYYIDNLVAYTVDDFKMIGTENTTDYNVNKTIKLTFNSKIQETVTEIFNEGEANFEPTHTYTLEDLIYLVDEAGNNVENGIASVNTADAGYSLEIKLSGVTGGKNYKLAIAPEFIDEYGQGLTDRSAVTYVDVTTTVSFETAKKEYIWGTETFEEYTKDVDWLQNLDSNKVVTATGVGTGKWRALNTAANNLNKGTVMVVDGTKVDANYTGGNVLEINALTTSGIGIRRNANPNATTGVPFNGTNPGKKVIYEVDVFMPSTTRSYNNAAFAQYSTGNGIDVMIDANKNGPYITTQSGAFYARQSAGSSSDAYYSSSRVDSSHFRGKWQHIKYVVDVSAAANATAGKERFDTSRMYLNGHLKTGVYANDVAATYAAYPKAKGDKVIDYLGRMGKPTAANTFYGVSFCMNKLADTSTNTYTGNYYIDNLVAYTVDDFKMIGTENTTDYNVNKTIKLTFNSKIQETVTEIFNEGEANFEPTHTYTLEDLIYLVDEAGNNVENGIASVNTADAGYSLEIKLSGVTGGKNYKLAIAPEFIDEYGQGLTDRSAVTYVDVSMDEYVDFTMVTGDVTLLGTTVSTNIKFANPTNQPRNAWYIIAVYGEYNEMLGSSSNSLTVGASQTTDVIDVNIENIDISNVKRVKIFLWDGKKTMVPYQDPVIIYGE